MSPNTMTIIYAGLDIAKSNLQLPLAGQFHDLPNSPAGHRRLIELLATQEHVHVICEATGGYERDVVAALASGRHRVERSQSRSRATLRPRSRPARQDRPD
jgi:transposase